LTDFLNDAEQRTDSWKRRHSPESIAQFGVWRWKGIQKHAGRILDLIFGKRVIDFGGADGPLGFGSIVVDQKAEYKTLADVPGKVDVIFTSHTLEHLDDPLEWLVEAADKLTDDGCLILHVPSWRCKRWRANEYANPKQPNGHKWTFALISDNDDELCKMPFLPIDILVVNKRVRLWSEVACNCGDNSIIVIARKA